MRAKIYYFCVHCNKENPEPYNAFIKGKCPYCAEKSEFFTRKAVFVRAEPWWKFWNKNGNLFYIEE